MACLEEATKNIDITFTNHQDLYDLEEEEVLLSCHAKPAQIERFYQIYQEYRQLISNRGQDYVRACIGDMGSNDACKKLVSLQDLANKKTDK
jgi:hypothetical protein